jgi:L-cysteate sulfo-lyase
MAVTAAGPAGGAGTLAMTGTDPAARVPLAVLPTPLVAAPRLAEAPGARALYVKRDGLPSPAGTAAAELAMRTEGLMVDPVYTAKALALTPRYAEGGNVVFWHTGGGLDRAALAAEAHR